MSEVAANRPNKTKTAKRVRARLVVQLLLLALRRDLLVVDVQGNSMAPTLLPGDRLMCSRRTPISPGVIAIRDAQLGQRQQIFHIKRVLALPGSEVHGRVIPPGFCWIEGDNKSASVDSRFFGAIPMSELVAVAIAALTRQGLTDLKG